MREIKKIVFRYTNTMENIAPSEIAGIVLPPFKQNNFLINQHKLSGMVL